MKKRGLALIGLALLLIAAVVLINTGKGRKLLKIAYYSRVINLRIALKKEEGNQVTLDSDGIRIMGSLYRPRGPALLPGIVLLHGSTPVGRKLPLYTLLAKKFASRGYAVLAIDLRGFGESEDPRNFSRAVSWDPIPDIHKAVDYLRSLPFIDISEIYLIGHSMGGSYAVAAAAANQRIRKVVAIGPARRIHSRIMAEDAPDRQYSLKRFSRDRMLDRALPMDVFLKIASSWELENYLDYISGDHHQPILLIDGGLERQEQLS